MRSIGILNTSIGSGNIGDQIIMDASMRHLIELMPKSQLVHFSSHDAFLYHALRLQTHVRLNLLCGTNCLSSHMAIRPGWPINPLSAVFMKPVITMGVGWQAYQGRPDLYTRVLLKKALSQESLLSVRDNYTKSKLEECGFTNVINTGCPTLWRFSDDFCSSIPMLKASKVVYTLTDYARDEHVDIRTLEILGQNYDSIFIWVQGTKDLEYLEYLYSKKPSFFRGLKVKLIPPSLGLYDAFLESNDLDYVGTRLHGGIRALQKKKRTIILAVDNRAEEKRRDFLLPVIKREAVEELDSLINSTLETSILLPKQEIEQFKNLLRELDVSSVENFEYI